MSLNFENSFLKIYLNLFIILIICFSFKTILSDKISPIDDGETNGCVIATNCSNCIKIPHCFWCADPSFERTNHSHYNYSRCNTKERHTNKSVCQSKYILDITGSINITRNESIHLGNDTVDRVKLSPQEIELVLRVGESQEIIVSYLEPKERTLDLYFLMDLSATMENDRNMVANLSEKIYDSLKNLTSKVRFGFGSFVDKPVPPFAYVNQLKPKSESDNTAVPYGFKNHVPLTDNITLFNIEVNRAKISSNSDAPEGGLDALYQAIKCEDQIGWDRKTDTRLIVLATDGPYHIAGDGKLAGILKRHDEKCHLVSNNDSSSKHIFDSTKMDYPTVSQMSNLIKAKKFYVIFAVENKFINQYEHLTRRMDKNSVVAKLNNDSNNIDEIIKKKYREISSSVELTYIPPDTLNITTYSKCSNTESFLEKNGCNVTAANNFNATFKLSIIANKCNKGSNEYQIGISTISSGNEKLTVKIKVICECKNCQEATEKENHEICNNKGKLECGTCKCNDGWSSKHCECNEKDEENNEESASENCKQNINDTYICSNNGKCICNKCECKKDYSGNLCQYHSRKCLSSNNLECYGTKHGFCENGGCICYEGYMGNTCECKSDEKPCILPGFTEICSNKGKCLCKGESKSCECGENKGVYCEKGKTSGEQKSIICTDENVFKCLSCHLNENQNNMESCSKDCQYIKNETKLNITVSKPEFGIEKYCEFKTNTDCKNYFDYKFTTEGLELEYSEKECFKIIDPIWIIVGVVGSIVLIGIISLLIWKLATSHYDKREYEKFEKERTDTRFAPGENPLYKVPSSTFANPMFQDK